MASQKKTLVLSDGKLLRGKEVAERLTMHPVSLSNMRQRKPYVGPPYVKVGGSVRYPLNLLEEWLYRRMVNPENERVA